MNKEKRKARRYPGHSKDLKDFVCKPHKTIIPEGGEGTLNTVAKENELTRKVCSALSSENPEKTEKELIKTLPLPKRHFLISEDISPKRIKKILLKTYENPPKDFLRLHEIGGCRTKENPGTGSNIQSRLRGEVQLF